MAIKAGAKAIKKALDMSKKARMKRAKEMGFDTDRALYHHTNADIESFIPSERGKLGAGVYFSPDPSYGARYVEPDGANIVPAYMRGKVATVPDIDAASELSKVEMSSDKFSVSDWKRRTDEILREQGFDGKEVGNEVVVFNPSNIRSKFAAFDPAKADSPNLLASAAPVAVGAGLLGQSEDSEASFLGTAAKSADKFMLSVAEKMEAAGIDPKEIWQKTGWGRGKDKQWRFEVDDSQAMLGDTSNPDFYADILDEAYGREGGVPLSRALNHPSVIGQYPQTQRASFEVVEPEFIGGAKGQYSPSANKVTLADPFAIKGTFEPLSTTLHETQHAIQEAEGFARGGSPNDAPELLKDHYRDRMDEVKKNYRSMRSKNPSVFDTIDKFESAKAALAVKYPGLRGKALTEAMSEADRNWMNNLQDNVMEVISKSSGDEELRDYIAKVSGEATKIPYLSSKIRQATGEDQYHRLAGEVEARNVQKRMGMTPQELRAKPPWETEDVPRDDQLVRTWNTGNINRPSGFATPEMLAATGGTAVAAPVVANMVGEGNPYAAEENQPSFLDKGMGVIEQGLEYMDYPLRGLLGLAHLPQGIDRAAQVARTPSDETLYEFGGKVTDKTRSPLLGTAAYVVPQFLSPL